MISVLTCTNKAESLATILENYDRQSWRGEKELLVILNNDGMRLEEWEKKTSQRGDVSVFQLPEETTLGECLNFGITKATYPYIAKFDDDDYYTKDYLSGSMETLRESGARVVGKTSIYMYFEEDKSLQLFNPYRFAPEQECLSENCYNRKVMMGGTLLFEKSVHAQVPFEACNTGEDAKFCEACIERNITIYSGPRDHYVYIRNKSNTSHTWRIKNEKLKRFCTRIAYTDDFRTYLSLNE